MFNEKCSLTFANASNEKSSLMVMHVLIIKHETFAKNLFQSVLKAGRERKTEKQERLLQSFSVIRKRLNSGVNNGQALVMIFKHCLRK